MFETLVLSAAYFLVITNITVIATMLPFMQQDISMSALQTTLILSLFPVISLPANLLLGPLVDRFNKKALLLTGSGLASVALFLSGLASNANQAVTLRATTAIFMSMVSCTIFSSIADRFAPDLRVRVTGYVSAAAAMAQLVSVPAGVLIAETFGWRTSFFVLGTTALCLSFLASQLPAPKYIGHRLDSLSIHSHFATLLSTVKNGASRIPLLGYATHVCGMFVFMSLYPTWLSGQSLGSTTEHAVSLILLAGGLGGLLGSLWTRAGAGLGSSWTTCSALSGLVALSLVAIPISSTLLLVQIACFGLACSFRSLFLPLLISMSMSAADPSQRGSTNGLLAAVFQLGTAIGGAIGAWLYSKDGSFVANVSVAVGLLFSAGLIFLRARGPAEVDA